VRGDNSFLSKLLEASFLAGALLCDGLGDFVSIETEADHVRATKLTYNVLQGAGARISKTEFVACPSCGTQNSATAKFCSNCGSSLQAPTALTCPKCGRTFHPKFNPPPVAGICPFDGTPLIQRKDDTEETARTRVQVYLRDTMPVIDYYRRQGLVQEIDALRSIPEVRAEIEKALEGVNAA